MARNGIQWRTLAPRNPAQAADSRGVLESATRRSAALQAFLRACHAAGEAPLIVVNDPHRSTRTDLALDALAARMGEQGIAPQAVILVGTGTHQFSPREREAFERAMLAGNGIQPRAMHWHESTNDSLLLPCGHARFSRVLLAHRYVLALGSVEPHYFAGATGAHKTVTIGCLAREDVERNHAGALDPASDILALRGNPVHDGVIALLESLQRDARSILALNQVLCGDNVVAAEAGEPLQALDALLPVARGVFVHEIDSPADILHLRVPPPLGRSLYQADKAFKNNHLAVRDGGAIILDAACEEGIGPDAFLKLLRRAPDYAAARRVVLEEGYRLSDHKAVKLRHLTDPAQRGVRLALVSRHVPDADAAACGMARFDALDESVRWASSTIDNPSQGLRIEDAGMTTVVARSCNRR